MSIECRECERDLRGGHADGCPRGHDAILGQLQRCITQFAYRFTSEKVLHDGVAEVLDFHEIDYQREVVRDGDRFDFLCRFGIVLEVKIGGSFAEAVRQARRYLLHDDVQTVVVLSSRPWCGGGKVPLSRKWVHFWRIRGDAF